MQASGRPPRILFPKKNMTYYRSLSGNTRQIPLSAEADSGVEILHWFAGTAYLGSSIPGQTLLWTPEHSGETEIIAVDDKGRSSKILCRIRLTP